MLTVNLTGLALPAEIIDYLTALSKDIDIDKIATKGANGYLFFGTNTILLQRVAIKFYYWGGDQKYHAEPSALASVTSPHILRVRHAGIVSPKWACFIADFCKNGDLDDFRARHPYSVKEAINAILDVLNGLSVLHSREFVHRDLKPQNILIDDRNRAVIGDFGSVKKIPSGQIWTAGSCHSVLYRPPEAFGANSRYYKTSDLYQVGVVLYQLLGGELSYTERDYLSPAQLREYEALANDADRSILVDKILSQRIAKGTLLQLSTLPCWIRHDMLRIIKKATRTNFARRYSTSSEMINALVGARAQCKNWKAESNGYYLDGKTNYRILNDGNQGLIVQKKKHSDWRNVTVLAGRRSLRDVVADVERLT